MKLWKKIDWLILLFLLAMFIVGIYIAPTMPDRVPTHWNIRGEVDGYGSKYINLFLMPSIALAAYLLMSFLPVIDPLRKNYEKFAKPYLYFKIFLAFFFIYLEIFLLYSSVRFSPPQGSLMFAIPFSLLLCFIGWILPQIKRNFFIGIRTPWSLVSDENWKKTHDFSGKVFIVAGIASLIASFFGSMASFIILIASVFTAVMATFVYSYLEYRKEKK
ncbi:SdpI family protein [Patescibacteria group bacterium]|nr:SdpI family protein [Patescibacteria group bacterium]